MEVIGLDHRTRELTGLRRTTTANGSLWVTGKEIGAVLNTTTIGTATTLETMTGTTTDTVIATTIDKVITTATIDSTTSEPLCSFNDAVVEHW